VRRRGRRFWIDRRKKLPSVLPNEIILAELLEFLEQEFSSRLNDCSLLDLGAGTAPYAPVYEDYFGASVTVDIPDSPHDISGIDVSASAEALPFESESFDLVLCTEVLEHCREPGDVFAEVARILKPGGFLFLTTPLMVGLHEQPRDFFRFTPFALEDLAANAGLETIYVRPKGGYVAVLMLLLQYPITKIWYLAEKKTRVPLYRPMNPFLFLSVVAPQLAYLAWWKRRRGHDAGSLSERLNRTTLGYVAVFRKGWPA
jgi:SAM-dependent methyltransferase